MVPLHSKSHYSVGFGTASLEALVDRAAACGLGALALTDLETMAGQVRFHDLCARRGIRAITGLELRGDPASPRSWGPRAGRLLLLARSAEGYRNLCRIVSWRRHETAAAPLLHRIVVSVIGRSEGLWLLSDDSEILEQLLAHKDISASSIGALVVRPCPNPPDQQRLISVATRLGLPLVADPEIDMLNPEDHELHLLVAAIRCNTQVRHLESGEDAASADRWFRSPADVSGLFADIPLAANGNMQVANACRFDLLSSKAPARPRSAAQGPGFSGTLQNSLERARAERRCLGETYALRLASEIKVIESLGYGAYFLAAADIARAARARNIPIAVRGSAVGSLVVHLLGVSELDPVEHGLYFERFLSEQRRAPPDIDIDVASARRDDLLRWTYRHFGRDRIAMVGAHHRFGLRSAMREGLRALGASRPEVERFSTALARRAELEPGATLEPEDLPTQLLPCRFQARLPLLLALVGMPRHMALHPGGVVLTDDDIVTVLPLERGSRGLAMAQYDAASIERLGLIKIDLLGNRFLEQMQETLLLAQAGGETTEPGAFAVPFDDARTLARIDDARTIGCFQIETPAMRSLLQKLTIASIEDCVAALALIRPGAAAGRTKQSYIERAHGEHSQSGPGPPDGAPGSLLYDEDLMALIVRLTGLSLGEADQMRSAIIDAAEDAGELLGIEQQFRALCARRDVDEQVARTAWDSLSQFAAYTFCKAHAWSYARLAYQAAYLKEHLPVEFGCALLRSYGGAYPLRTIAADLSRSGISVLGPSVVASERRASVVRTGSSAAIRVGLGAIRGLTSQTAARLLRLRDSGGGFADLVDFLDRVRPSTGETRSLVLSGSCDDIAPLSAAGYPWVHRALLAGLAGETRQQALEAAVRAAGALAVTGPSDRATRRRYQLLVRIQNELHYLSMHLCAHPMSVLRADAQRHGCLTSEEIARPTPERNHQSLRFAGIVAATHRHSLGQGRRMQFLTLEDEFGLLEAVIEPARHRRLSPRITTPGPYLCTGRIERERGQSTLILSDLIPFHERGRVDQDRS